MNTEITDNNDGVRGGCVFFDAHCAFCRRWVERVRPRLERAGYSFVPLQSPEASAKTGISEALLLDEMRVITPRGTVLGGADALLHLAGKLRGGKLLRLLALFPGVRSIIRLIYRYIARHRSCSDGIGEPQTSRPGSIGVGHWLPLVLFVSTAFIFGSALPSWAYMWVLVVALYAGCKWLSFSHAGVNRSGVSWIRSLGYLLAWPGMDADAFLRNRSVTKPATREWLFASAKIVAGLPMWKVARDVFSFHPLLAGWLAMTGFVLIVHFGLLELLSLTWRLAGVDAMPLMRSPLRSKSLAEFWGLRWNTGFHYLAHQYVFLPARRMAGARGTLLLVFLVSGLIHDLVISRPARAGYGLPTAYFLLQGAGILFERSRFARRIGVGKAWRGWLFTILITAGPAFWLFHPIFVLNVIVPFFKTIHVI